MTSVPRARRDLTRLAVLSMLVEQPRHPYELLRLIRERRKEFVTGLPRSLYHVVDRLLEAELIAPAETSREGKRPERTVYRITPRGLQEYLSWMSDLITVPREEHPPFTAVLSLLAGLPPKGVVDRLRVRAAVLEREIDALAAQRRAVQGGLPRVALLETEYTGALRQAELDWVRAVIDDITAGRLTWDSGPARRIAALGMLAPMTPDDNARKGSP